MCLGIDTDPDRLDPAKGMRIRPDPDTQHWVHLIKTYQNYKNGPLRISVDRPCTFGSLHFFCKIELLPTYLAICEGFLKRLLQIPHTRVLSTPGKRKGAFSGLCEQEL
jgi:hypothetical protein